MTIEMKKVWFVDGQIVEQHIPESDIYKRHWNIDACKEYVKQLRDKTRANTAEHAAEAIEFLLTECDALMALAQPCPTCEALARTVMLDQTSHDTTPPQRKPLTDEEIEKCYETTGHYQTLRPQDRFAVFALARALEAKLKEKNT
jgi:hypothetical protein